LEDRPSWLADDTMFRGRGRESRFHTASAGS